MTIVEPAIPETPIDTTPMPSESTVISRDGTLLRVRQYGPDSAAHTVVLMHGLCLDQDSWGVQAAELSREYGDTVRVISYDHRGHGESGSAPMSTYRIRTLATDLADILRVKKVKNHLTLVGHSMGGFTALEYLALPDAERPVYPEAVVLVATAAGKIAERGLGRLLVAPAINAFYTLVGHVPHRVADPLARAMAAPVCRALLSQIGYGVNYDAALAAVAAGSINDTKLSTKAGFIVAIRDYDCYAVLPTITADVTIISGGNDLLTPKSHSDEMDADIPHSRHQHYASAGHMLMHEVPAAVMSAITRTFNSAIRTA